MVTSLAVEKDSKSTGKFSQLFHVILATYISLLKHNPHSVQRCMRGGKNPSDAVTRCGLLPVETALGKQGEGSEY